MRLLVGGVTVLTTATGKEKRGMTATAVCSLSAEPPRILACINMSGEMFRLVSLSGVLTVNFLGAGHEDVAMMFGGARPSDDPLDHLQWVEGSNGAPRFSEAVAALECTVADVFPYGTHAIVVCDVRNIETNENPHPLVYVNGRFEHLAAADHKKLNPQ